MEILLILLALIGFCVALYYAIKSPVCWLILGILLLFAFPIGTLLGIYIIKGACDLMEERDTSSSFDEAKWEEYERLYMKPEPVELPDNVVPLFNKHGHYMGHSSSR